MTLEEAISKCRKLFYVSERHRAHGTLEEAALAAAKAAAIMQEYQIEEAALSSINNELNDEVDSHLFDGEDNKRKSFWRMKVAQGVSIINNCRPFWIDSQIHLIGRKSDVQASRYLFEMIVAQIEQLSISEWNKLKSNKLKLKVFERLGKPLVDLDFDISSSLGIDFDSEESKRSWRHSFLLGCATTVAKRLYSVHYDKMRELKRQADMNSSSSNALMVLDNRLSKVQEYCSQFAWETLRTGPTTASSHGFYTGKEAGKNINIGSNSRGYISDKKKELR